MWSSVVRDESPMLFGMTLVRRMSWEHVATSALSVYARGTGVFFPFEMCLYWYMLGYWAFPTPGAVGDVTLFK